MPKRAPASVKLALSSRNEEKATKSQAKADIKPVISRFAVKRTVETVHFTPPFGKARHRRGWAAL